MYRVLGVTLSALVLCVAGCGGGDDTADATTTSEAEPDGEEAAEELVEGLEDEEADGSATPEYVAVETPDGRASAEVPSTWSDVVEPELEAGGGLAPGVVAATDAATWQESWGVSGMAMVIGPRGTVAVDPDDVAARDAALAEELRAIAPETEQCEPQEHAALEFPQLTGLTVNVADYFADCGGDTEYVVMRLSGGPIPEDEQLVVRVTGGVDPEDADALASIIDTLAVR